MALTALTEEILFILAFFIPGYVGVKIILGMITAFYPGFRYQIKRLDTTAILVASVIVSAAVYLVQVVSSARSGMDSTIPSFSTAVTNLTVKDFFVMVLWSAALAFALAIIILSVLTFLIAFVTLLNFFAGFQMPGKKLKYWSFNRLMRVRNKMSDELEETFSDGRYWALLQASKKRCKVRLILVSGQDIEGRVDSELSELQVIKLHNKKSNTYVAFEDIRYIELKM